MLQGNFDEAEDPDDYEGESDADSEDINDNDATPASKGAFRLPRSVRLLYRRTSISGTKNSTDNLPA
jgi:hypothetical protein